MARTGVWIALALVALACNESGGRAESDVRDAADDATVDVADEGTPDPGDTADTNHDATPDAPGDAVDATDADAGSTLLASATQVPAGAFDKPALVIALVGTDDAARTVTVEVALEGPVQAAGVAFDLAYDAGFLTPVDSALGTPFPDVFGATIKVLGAFVPERARYSFGATLLRSAPVSIQETYYEKGVYPMPDQALTGRRVLATLTFTVAAGGSGTLALTPADSVVKDRLFQPIPVTRVGLALVAN